MIGTKKREASRTPTMKPKSSKKKRADHQVFDSIRHDPFFAVVFTKDSEEVNPVCFAKSYSDAQRKVDALRAELCAYTEAGGGLRGEERFTSFFCCDSKGNVFEWDWKEEKAKFTRYPTDPEASGYKEKRAGKKIWVNIDEELYPRIGEGYVRTVLYGDITTASMVFSAKECATEEVHAGFWRNIRKLPYSTIEALREIYALVGDYQKIPTEDSIKKIAKGLESDEEDSDPEVEKAEADSEPV